MNNFIDNIKKYLLSNSEQHFSEMINLHLYNIFLKLLKRNGVYRDRFSYNDFASYFFIAITENRDELLSLSNETEDAFVLISKITNLILKELNRYFYKNNNIRKKEVLIDEITFSYITQTEESLENNIEEKNMSLEALVKEVLSKYSYKIRLSIEMYIGLDRLYRLSVDQICKIININRSTLFSNVRNFKKTIEQRYTTKC
jgi:hypothetical protein